MTSTPSAVSVRESVAGDVVQVRQRPALGVGHEQGDVGQRALELGGDPLAQVLEALAGDRAHEHGVRVAEGELGAALGVDRVGLVEHEHARAVGGVDLLEHVFDRARHLHQRLLGLARVDDVQHEVGQRGLLERRRERVHELVRQLADEADGVGHQERAALQLQRAGRRVERVEEPVADADLGAA